MAKKDKKPVPDKVFKREGGTERRQSDVRPQSTTPTSGLRNLDRRGSMSPPKSRQREISWVDYEDLIKARQEEKQVVSTSPRSRTPSPVSRASSRGRSSIQSRSKKKRLELDDRDDMPSKGKVRFSASLPVRPKESLPFPFLRRTSQVSLPGDRRRISLRDFSLEPGKNYQGELDIEEGRSIVFTPRVPGDKEWRDASREPPSIIQKLDVEGLAMHEPPFLKDIRGESRRSSLRALSKFGKLLPSHRRSAFVRSVMASANIDGTQVVPRLSSKYITVAPKTRLSTVIVPVNAKQWLLEVMCQKDLQLRELFDQMDLVPQFAGDHVREVRAEWDALESLQMLLPPEAETLIKDKTLLERVKGLLVHFNEPVHSKSPELVLIEEENRITRMTETVEGDESHEEQPEKGEVSKPEKRQSRSRSPSRMFQGFERDREGSLSPVFGLSVSLCPLCGQNRTFTKDGQPPPSNTLKLLGSDGETRTHLSFNDKRWFVVLFPALQPANKDKIELLGEWLRYSMRQNNCEHYDGRFADICSAFILHAIAFLEVVRQVRLQCEERGDMLLHVWRQILRVFTQVIIRVEPKLLAALEETSHLKEIIQSDRKKINQISDELALTTHNLEVTQAQLREKEVQWTQLKRCRFCAGGDDQGRDSRGRKGKHGSGIEGKHGVGASGESAVGDDGSFGFEKSHQRGDEDAEGSGPGGGAETGDAKPRGEHGGTVSAGPGDQGNAGGSIEGVGKREDLNANKHGKISEGYLHPDGLRANVGVQTDPEKTGRSLFFNILKRPVSAPAKMVTAIMEEFALAGGMVKRDRADGEEEQDKKEPEVIGLSAADMAMLEATDDMAEEVEVQTIDKKALKSLAMDSINVLEHVPDDQLEEKMTQTLFNLLGRFRNLKLSTGPDEVDDEDEGEGGSGTKKSRWGKLQRGFEEKKKNTKNFVAVVQELLARQKKPPAKMTKPKDLPNIPLAFSKMMKVNPPPKIVKLFNEHQVVKLVDAVYQKKIEADAVDDLQGNERQTACEFLYDFMLNSYGLKGLAESAVHGVFRRIKQMMVKGIDKCHKLRLFQQFCGFDPLRGYGEPDFYLYLRCLARAQSKVGVLFPSDNEQDTVMNTNPNQADILLEEPALLAQFKDDKDVALDFIEQFSAANGSVEKVSNEVQKLVKAPTVRKVDFDLLMEAIIEVAPHKADFKMPPKKKAATKAAPAITKEESTSLETLFKAGDANQDGVLTFNEFREIIESADSSVSEKQALRMFRETLQVMSGEGDSISPAAFATVAYSNGIRATPAVIFELLKKTWLQIQDDVNEEKFADDVKEKDYEDMRTELEAMLKEKDPGEVFKTVQIFSDFVIRFCGPMHAAAATEEPAATEEAAAAEERADSDEVKEEREITD